MQVQTREPLAWSISKASVSFNILWFSFASPTEDTAFSKRTPPLPQFIPYFFDADKGPGRELEVLEICRIGSPGHSDPTSACNRYRLNAKHLIILLSWGNITETKWCIIKFHTEAYLPWPLTKMLEPVASRRNGPVNHSCEFLLVAIEKFALAISSG